MESAASNNPKTPTKAQATTMEVHGSPSNPSPTKSELMNGSELSIPLLSVEDKAAEVRDADLDMGEDDEIEDQGSSMQTFKHTVRMAFGTGCVCLLTALPVLIPSWYRAIDPNYSGLIGCGTVMMVVFTVYGNVGLTIQLVYQGVIGTFIACLPVHMCSVMMPGGAKNPKVYIPLIAHTANVVSIVLGLWLNISRNIRLFWLSYHCYFMMEYMNPESTYVFNTSWAINWEAYTTTTLITASIGCIAALLVVFVPVPVRAIQSCRSSAIESVNMWAGLLDKIVEYYERHSASVRIVQSEAGAVALREMLLTLQSDLDGAWWECFDIGAQGKTREFLGRHLEMMNKMSDTIFALLVCIEKEDFGESHVSCMEAIQGPVHALVNQTKSLLAEATQAANDGDISMDEEDHLAHMVEGTRKQLKDLAEVFHEKRMEISPNEALTPELQSESFFVYSLSVCTRTVIEYTEHMLNEPPNPPSIWRTWAAEFKSVFDPSVLFKDPEYKSFTIRNSLSIIICYYIGFYILGYSAISSGTASLLLSQFSGSALQKNLGRLQGVVVGNIVPHLFLRVIGSSCHPFRISLQGAFIVFWETLTCYIYYSSPVYGYIGMLAAAFAMTNVVVPCSDYDDPAVQAAAEAAFAHTAFSKITETTVAVVMMTVVDLALAPERASSHAIAKLLEGFMSIDAGLQAAFVPRYKGGYVKKGSVKTRPVLELDLSKSNRKISKIVHHKVANQIKAMLKSAMTFGDEANKEPRYYRTVWPIEYFSGLVTIGYYLRADLRELEFVLKGTDGKYTDIFAAVREKESFKKVREDVCQTMEDCLILIKGILRNETGASNAHLIYKMAQLEGIDKVEDLISLMADLNTTLEYPNEIGDSLEDDLICRLNVALMLIEATVENLAGIVTASLKNA